MRCEPLQPDIPARTEAYLGVGSACGTQRKRTWNRGVLPVMFQPVDVCESTTWRTACRASQF